MNFGNPIDPAIEWLIRAAIYTSCVYVWLCNYWLWIFLAEIVFA